MYSREKSEHNKTKTVFQQKVNDLMAELKQHESSIHETSCSLKKME